VSTSTTSCPSGRIPSVSSTGWEEPHPGQKLAFPVGAGSYAQGAHQDGIGANRGSRDDTVGTRESSMGQDSSVLSPTISVGSTASTPYVEAVGTSLEPSISPGSRSAGSLPVSEAHSSALTTHTLHVDVDMDRYNKMELDKAPVTQSISPAPSNFSDVSNYLDSGANPGDMFGVVSLVSPDSPDSFSCMSPDIDMYGWDAAWDRRADAPLPPIPSDHREQRSLTTPYRRGRRTKSTLLGRVFSVGKVPSRLTHDRERR